MHVVTSALLLPPRAPRPFFCGNWKLLGTIAESVALATDVRDGSASVSRPPTSVVAPGFIALHAVAQRLRGSPVGVAAQDCFWEDKGAFTGEVSAPADRRRRRRLRHRRPLRAPPALRRDRRCRGPERPRPRCARPGPDHLRRRNAGRTRRRARPSNGSAPAGRRARAETTEEIWPVRHRLRAGLGDRHRAQRDAGAGGRGAPLHPIRLAERLGG